MKHPFVLYHWSHIARRKSILKHGLVPGKKSRCGLWRPPYVCYADTPQRAWLLSGKNCKERHFWDLWALWSDDVPKGWETLQNGWNRSGKAGEYRIYDRVPKSKLWYVGSRV